MSDTDNLDSYKQIGNSDPTDSYIPGEGKQRIDLDEYYKDTDQPESTYMVQGFEALSMGKLSRDLARNLKLENAQSYDPFPSERNARAGNEGFFSAVAEKFEALIVGIIKYIRMAIDWVVDTIKGFFGFRKSTRITAEIDKHQKDIQKDFEKTLVALGFPVAEYNLESFLSDLPAGELPKHQFTFMRSKFETDKDAIDGLSKSLPLIQQAVAKLKQVNDKVVTSQKFLKKTINEEYNRVRVRKSTGNFNSAADSTEINRVIKAIQEVRSTLDTRGISEVVRKLYEELYKVKFSDEELTNGFDKVRTQLKTTVSTQKVSFSKINVGEILTSIQSINKRYLEISDKELDLSGVKWREIGEIVDKTESDKVKSMSDHYKAPGLLAEYHAMSTSVREFVQFCFSVSQSMMQIEKQSDNLVTWYNRSLVYYYSGVIGDIDTMRELAVTIMKEQKSDSSALLTKKGKLKPLYFIKEADAQTFMERSANISQQMYESDAAGVKTSLKNFAKQIGYGGALA